MRTPKIDLDPSTVAIVAAAVVGGFLLWKVGRAVPQTVQDAADMAGGLLTGNNAITQGARTDAYQNAGILGTLGAATDRLSGGVLSRFGEWLGDKTYDLTH